MLIKRFFGFCFISLALVGCVQQGNWYGDYGTLPTTAPVQIQGDLFTQTDNASGSAADLYTHTPAPDASNVAVLLPLSGAHTDIGHGIRTSIEMAFLQRPYKNVSVTFYDLSGNRLEKQDTIQTALATEPKVILGPVFAEDVQLIRDLKPLDMPVLSFSSDANAFGNGVMTMALMPTQSVEAIVKEMTADKTKRFIVVAPNTPSGKLMAGAAVQAANIYDMPLSGLFYYAENDSESVKQTAQKASMFTVRSAANTRAKEILSDILTNETLTGPEKSSLNAQLDKINKSDTIGKVPYDAILFLGNGDDSKTMASFLRYYDVSARDARFYGTALWDSSELTKDLTMSGAKFAVLPKMSDGFSAVYEQVSGRAPTRLDAFGFDAVNLVIGMLYSPKSNAAYLLDPSGYNGMDGLFRLKPAGESERALQIVELNGSGDARLITPAAADFLRPLYNINQRQLSPARAIDLISDGVNPMTYIKIPVQFQNKYKSKTFGARTTPSNPTQPQIDDVVIVMPEDDRDVVMSPDFQPVALESIDRKLIDSIEVNE